MNDSPSTEMVLHRHGISPCPLLVLLALMTSSCTRAGYAPTTQPDRVDFENAGDGVDRGSLRDSQFADGMMDGSAAREPDMSAQDVLAELGAPPGGDTGASTDAQGDSQPAPACPGGPTVFYTNMPARRVLGQRDFVTSAANRGGAADASSLNRPLGLVVHGSKLLVSDTGSNRILVFEARGGDGEVASAVIGQPDFVSTTGSTSASTLNGPQGLALTNDALLVAEWSNARATIWPLASLYSTPSVATVFGQGDVSSATPITTNVTARSLAGVASFIAVGPRYIVTDSSNHRVLVFESNVSNPPAAVAAIGQPDLLSNAWGPGPQQLDFPLGVASDGQRLVISDSYNNRLLFFEEVPTSSGPTPDLSWGSYGASALTLAAPVGVFSREGRLFVADRKNDRVLIFNAWPTSSTQPADVVLGQADFSSGDHNQGNGPVASANSLWGVHFVFHDGCRLFVSDTQNNRVLVY